MAKAGGRRARLLLLPSSAKACFTFVCGTTGATEVAIIPFSFGLVLALGLVGGESAILEEDAMSSVLVKSVEDDLLLQSRKKAPLPKCVLFQSPWSL